MTNKAAPRSNDRPCHAEEIFKILPQIIHHFSHSLHTTRRHASLARNTEKDNQFASYAQMVKYSQVSVPFFSLVYSSIAWSRKFPRSHSNHDWFRTSVISKGKDLSDRYLHGPGLNIHGGYGRHLTLSKWRYACAVSLFRFSACMLSFDFILGWNFVFCFFKFIILHYFYPKIKENIIQTKYTFEPQLVRGQKRAFEMREIHECKERHQTLFSSRRPKSPSFNSFWIRPGYGVEKGSFLFTCQLFLRDVCFHHILPWLSKNI